MYLLGRTEVLRETEEQEKKKGQKAKYKWHLGEICLRSMYLNQYIFLKSLESCTSVALAVYLSNLDADHLYEQFQKQHLGSVNNKHK